MGPGDYSFSLSGEAVRRTSVRDAKGRPMGLRPRTEPGDPALRAALDKPCGDCLAHPMKRCWRHSLVQIDIARIPLRVIADLEHPEGPFALQADVEGFLARFKGGGAK